MKRLLIAAALCASWGYATPASAASLRVDDDRNQCPGTPYRTIQSAVEAAAPGDAIYVCPGTYREQVRVPADKPQLKLISSTPLGAKIVAPADPAAIISEGARDRGIVQIKALGTSLRGFEISGPFPPPSDFYDCFASFGVSLNTGSATIDSNRIVDIRVPGCENPAGEGINTSAELGEGPLARSVTITNNRIERFGSAGVVVGSLGAPATVRRNRIANPDGSGSGIVGVEAALIAQGNEVSGTEVGIAGYEFSLVQFLGNAVHDNDVGFVLSSLGFDDPDVVIPVWSNRSFRNRVGLQVLGSNHLSLRRNSVRDNTGNGIALDADSFANLVRDNVSLGNGGLDCLDEGGAPLDNVWRDNIGVTDAPATLCRRP